MRREEETPLETTLLLYNVVTPSLITVLLDPFNIDCK